MRSELSGDRRVFLLLLLLTVGVSLAAVLAFDRQNARDSLLDLTNLVGPTTASLLHGGGLTACTVLLGRRVIRSAFMAAACLFQRLRSRWE